MTYDFINLKNNELKEERNNAINDIIKALTDQNLFLKLIIPNIGLLIKMIEENIFNLNDNNKIRTKKKIKNIWII